MVFTLFTSTCRGSEKNCFYNKEVKVDSPEKLKAAVENDHVCATYKNCYRGIGNFIKSDVIPMDIDNDHTDDPALYVTLEKLDELFPDVSYCIVPSRNHNRPKGSKPAAPRYHIYFPIPECSDVDEYTQMKVKLHRAYPFFDDNALDAGRFLYGAESKDVVWHEGWLSITDEIEDFVFGDDTSSDTDTQSFYGQILEGSRNNTMSHFAGRILKKYGVCEKARDAYLERAAKCEPPLSKDELDTIWNSAVRFYKKVSSEAGYISPEKFNDEFAVGGLKPDDYSDIGEAKIIAKYCSMSLRYTSATDFIAFHRDRWYEDGQKSLGIVEDFLDIQLEDAEKAVKQAEDNLIAIGIDEKEVKARDKNLARSIPMKNEGLLLALISADAYKKFVMKYRNYRNIVNAQNAAKPMVAIDVSELDYDPELLNTPVATYDLSKGLEGAHPHDPDDLITKITACGPGEKGEELWNDSLNLFFCGDRELISYVQEIVGMAAVGKVYAEHLIIAYGDGANGKSTFWNTIARVIGSYSGKISAEALTMNVKRNVKPEMAELKGKRLVIASELEEGTRLNTGMVKQLCSVDPIEAEKKFKDPFHFDPSHTLVLYTNHLPKVSANDDGTWRRLIVIPFNAKITGKSDIKNYSDYLFDNAGPAIMKWIIKGAEIAINKGFRFTKPAAVSDAVEAYREENDWLGQFLEDHCDVESGYEEKSGELYQCYRAACLATGEYIRSTSDFYGALEKAGFKRRRKNTGRIVIGLRLKDGQDFIS